MSLIVYNTSNFNVHPAINHLKEKEKYRETSLHNVVRCGDVEAVKKQLSNGFGDVDAVNMNEVVKLEYLVHNMGTVFYILTKNISHTNYMFKMTPLFLAACEGKTRIAQILLDHKTDINSKLNTMSPLSIAIIRGHKEVVNLLFERGADVTAKENMFGNTPLHMALYCKHEDIATEICQKFIVTINSKSGEATVDVENNSGETPLYYAVITGLNKLVKILLENKADANYKTKCRHTPFEMAAIRFNADLVATILELFDINILINCEIKNPDNILISRNRKIQDTILRHIIKLKVAGFYLNEYIVAHNSFYEQNPFHRECEEEIKRMQEKIIGLPVSYHDILLSDSVKSCYFKNRNLAGKFEKGFYKREFPIYAPELERKCGPEVRRQKLLREGSQSLISLSSGVTRLPDICSDKIVSYLNNNDLEHLINACNSFSEIP